MPSLNIRSNARLRYSVIISLALLSCRIIVKSTKEVSESQVTKNAESTNCTAASPSTWIASATQYGSSVMENYEKKEFSQYALIEKYHLSRGTLDQLVHNRNITMNTLDILCSILDCKVEDVISYVPDKPKDLDV